MSTSRDKLVKPVTRPTSRSDSTRSRKHSAPVQIHALLGATSTDDTGRKHGGHRRGASLSTSATVSPTPIDRPTGVQSSTVISHNDTHFLPSPLQQTRQRSHSYASAPLSTLLTHLESPSLASFTLADPHHPCAAGSLRRCQWMMEMNASGHWYTGDDESIDDSFVQHNNKNVDLPPKRKRMLALPIRLWKKKNISFVNHEWDSESDSHADVEDDDGGIYCEESDSDGADDTPSLTSRRSSRSRSSADDRSPISPLSSSSRPPSGSRTTIPPVSRRYSDDSSPPLVTGLVGARPVPSSTVAVRHSGDAKVASATTTGSSTGKKVFKQDPGTALQHYKEAPITPSLTVKQNMQTEPIPSSSRTLRSSKNRRIGSNIPSSTPNTNHVRIPFPVNPSSLSPTSPPTSNPPVLLTLSDLERTSKLMRSTTTCAVCGRSGSDFPRCPRTGAAWCSRACRISAKKSASS